MQALALPPEGSGIVRRPWFRTQGWKRSVEIEGLEYAQAWGSGAGKPDCRRAVGPEMRHQGRSGLVDADQIIRVMHANAGIR